MEKYRKTIKIRMALLAVIILFAMALGVYDVFFASEAAKESFIVGFQIGGVTGMGLVAIFAFIRLGLILADDTKLKRRYNVENDERLKAIRAKSGMPMLLVTSGAMLIAGIIAGYFNQTVFFTLIAAAVCQMLVGAVVKGVNLKRM